MSHLAPTTLLLLAISACAQPAPIPPSVAGPDTDALSEAPPLLDGASAPGAASRILAEDGSFADGAIVAVWSAGSNQKPHWLGAADRDGRVAIPDEVMRPNESRTVTGTAGHRGSFYIEVEQPRAPQLRFKLRTEATDLQFGGRALNADGTALANVFVEAARLSERDETYFARTNHTGAFTFRLPDSGYQVRIRDGQHRSEKYAAFVGLRRPVSIVAFNVATLEKPVSTQVKARVAKLAKPVSSKQPTPSDYSFDGVRVVGLGEATHGTHEFQAWKVAFTKRQLASRKFRFVALEAPWAETRAINRYLVDGKGRPEKLLAGVGFWLWDTKEFLGLMRWIRKENRSRPRSKRIWLLGVDAQSLVAAAKSVLDTARVQTNEKDPSHAAVLALANGKGRRYIRNLSHADADALLNYVEKVESAMASEKTATFEEALKRRDAVALRQAITLARSANFLDGENTRDEFMAKNLLWWADRFPNDGVILWGHNGHVTMAEANRNYPTGAHLKAALGNGYRSIGFSFGSGRFRVRDGLDKKSGVIVKQLEAANENFFERAFPTNRGWLFLDLESAVVDNLVREWLLGGLYSREVGAVYWSEKLYQPRQLSKLFDAIVFIPSMTPTRATKTGHRPPGR